MGTTTSRGSNVQNYYDSSIQNFYPKDFDPENQNYFKSPNETNSRRGFCPQADVLEELGLLYLEGFITCPSCHTVLSIGFYVIASAMNTKPLTGEPAFFRRTTLSTARTRNPASRQVFSKYARLWVNLSVSQIKTRESRREGNG